LRYLDEKYNFVSYGKEDGKSVFLADVYDGNQGFIVYGHQGKMLNMLYMYILIY
jgi:bis(5'-nucleosyl)-tetraphosphatase (symmetrical)